MCLLAVIKFEEDVCQKAVNILLCVRVFVFVTLFRCHDSKRYLTTQNEFTASDDDFYPLHSLDWMLTIILLVRRKRGEILSVFDFDSGKKCSREDGAFLSVVLFSAFFGCSLFVHGCSNRQKEKSNFFQIVQRLLL